MCADRSVKYGWEVSPTDMCALLLRSLLATGSDMADLLRVIGGLDLIGMVFGGWTGSDCGASNVGDAWVVWCCALPGMVSGCAGSGDGVVGGSGLAPVGTGIAIERVTRLSGSCA